MNTNRLVADLIHEEFWFSERTREIFTEGVCYTLAKSVARRVGGTVMYVVDSSSNEPFHAVVKVKDLYVDIYGVWKLENLLLFWDRYNVSISHKNEGLEYRLIDESTLKEHSEHPTEDVETIDPSYFDKVVDIIVKQLNMDPSYFGKVVDTIVTHVNTEL
jgi:hypothetical protein